MSPKSRSSVFVLGLLLVVAMAMLQSDIDPKRSKIQSPIGEKRQAELIFQLPGPYILATFTGMRETVAGLLWVRCDEFFHEGNYEAIMPLVRLITWLDPHYMDVFKTGAWHLDFNICDTAQRSDRRYIPPALALLQEGIKKNPDTYDLPFDLAFVHYNLKIKDYAKAAEWLEKASRLPDLNPEKVNAFERYPLVVKRMLAHQYEKLGDIPKANIAWHRVIDATQKMIDEHPRDQGLKEDLGIATRNFNMLRWREARRRWDVHPIINTNFQPKWVRTKPKVLMISGTVNLVTRADYLKLNPLSDVKGNADSMRTRLHALKLSESPNWANGAKVEVTLTDLDYKREALSEFSWDVPKNVTIAVDTARIADGKFQVEMDLSKDPLIYSFKSKKYLLTMTVDPRDAPDYVQDRIGWHGEGITDKRYLDTKTVPGVRLLRARWIVDREDLI